MRERRTRAAWIGAAALLMVASLLPVAAAGATESGDAGLFTPAASGRSYSAPAEVTRHRDVAVDVDSLFFPNGNAKGKAAMGTLTLNLFDDVTYTGTVERLYRESLADTWSGTLDGTEQGYFHMAVADGTYAAHVNDGTNVFEVESDGAGGYRVIELDQSQFVDHPPGSFDDPIVGDPMSEADLRDLGRAADSGDVIDILVVYTPAARVAEGGTAGVEAMIALAMAETNTSYDWSGTSPQLRLMHVEEVPYVEYDPDGPCNPEPPYDGCLTPFDSALDDLRNGNGALSGVLALRNLYGADMVGMIIDDSSYCGLAAGILPGETYGYQVTDNDCATGYYSFGHEFGHLQGAHHDEYVAPGSSVWIEGTQYAYNNGWVHLSATPAQRWRTVMAYNSECVNAGYNCTRLQYWSNPNTDLGGCTGTYPNVTCTPQDEADAAGGPGAKNAKILNLSAATVANWRKSRGDDFSTPFNKTKGWGPVVGAWAALPQGWYYSKGKYNKIASTYRAGKYGDITFEAVVRRRGECTTCANQMYIRGNKGRISAFGEWEPAYVFQFANDGQFSVFRYKPNGSYLALKDWEAHAAIKPFKWNRLKVVAVGSSLSFYINNQLVWTGTDSLLTHGHLGLGFYRDDTFKNRLFVDSAEVITTAVGDLPPLDGLFDEVEPFEVPFERVIRSDG